MHLWFSPADGGDAEGRAGRAAASGVGRGDAEPPPSRREEREPGAALPPRCSVILVCRHDS